jgi:Putative peptidoglycan binding domain
MRRQVLAGAVLLAVLVVAGVAVTDPFAGHAATHDSSLDNGSPTSTRRVERTTLASQAQVNGTLGFVGNWTVSLPAGTDPSAVAQAEQAVGSARSTLSAAQATARSDARSLRQARAGLRAANRQRRAACRPASGSSGSGPNPGTDCPTAQQAVAGAEAALTSGEQRSIADGGQLSTAAGTLASAGQSLAAARSSATSYGSSASYTMLPSPGRIVRRGQRLFAIDGQPSLLLFGSTPAWRVFRPGMSPAADVAELNENLRALGYGVPPGDTFTPATSSAISALQSARGIAPTGTLKLGAVVFEPGPLRVKTVMATPGQAAQPGPVLSASSTHHGVSIPLDAAQQSEVEVGDRVIVTLPDGSTTLGVVSSVGKVATASTSSSQQTAGGSSPPTINVTVRLLDPRAAGHLDEAPVEVSITVQSVRDVLAVPVDALVALAGGGYAVEVAEPDGAHRLVAVKPGLFDDAAGLVQVAGTGLAVDQRVVVPAS